MVLMVNQSKTQILDMTIPQKMGHFQAILIAMIGHLIKMGNCVAAGPGQFRLVNNDKTR